MQNPAIVSESVIRFLIMEKIILRFFRTNFDFKFQTMIPKKIFSFHLMLTTAAAFLLPLFSFAQLPQGSIAPDWTLTDIHKNVWHLYDLTSQGKTVFIDISATWCGPCWRYHKQRSLDSLYEEHGPKGTIDQTCEVFLIEGDGGTTYNDLNGTGKKTNGN